jgi:hypothetical protein
LPVLPGIRWGEFDRGFVSEFEADTVAAFEANASAILAAPVLPSLILVDRDRSAVALLARSRHLDALCGLTLSRTRSSPEQLAALFGSDRLGRLRSLTLSGQPMRRVAVRALADASSLADLRHLYLFVVGLGTRGTVALASSSHLTRLTSLSLRGNAIGGEGAAALADSPILAHHDARPERHGNRDHGSDGPRRVASAWPPDAFGSDRRSDRGRRCDRPGRLRDARGAEAA